MRGHKAVLQCTVSYVLTRPWERCALASSVRGARGTLGLAIGAGALSCVRGACVVLPPREMKNEKLCDRHVSATLERVTVTVLKVGPVYATRGLFNALRRDALCRCWLSRIRLTRAVKIEQASACMRVCDAGA